MTENGVVRANDWIMKYKLQNPGVKKIQSHMVGKWIHKV